jgi:hypothetical protein
LPAGLLFAWLFLPKNINVYFVLYIFTSFFYEIGLTQASKLLSFLPSIFQPRVVGYTNEIYAENVQSSGLAFSAYVQIAGKVANFLLYSWIIFLFVRHFKWSKYLTGTERTFTFALFLGTFANLASGIPSGGRYLTLSTFLFFAVIIITLSQKKRLIYPPWLKYFSIGMLTYVVVFNVRLGLDYMGVSTFISNPIMALFAKDTKPLIEFVKEFFG